MQIEERRVGTVIVLDAKGKLTLGDGDVLLKDKIHSLVQQGHKQIVLNLGGVPYVDSAGIGEIVGSYTTLSRAGGTLRLLNLTKRIHDLLAITKLLTVFETFTTEDEAVRSFPAIV
jgi:anti-sigma B factor antagonist